MTNVSGSSKCYCFKQNFRFHRLSYKKVYSLCVGMLNKLCSFEGCDNIAEVGGHIECRYGRNWYIAPICSECNEISYNDLERKLKKDIDIVLVKCNCNYVFY